MIAIINDPSTAPFKKVFEFPITAVVHNTQTATLVLKQIQNWRGLHQESYAMRKISIYERSRPLKKVMNLYLESMSGFP